MTGIESPKEISLTEEQRGAVSKIKEWWDNGLGPLATRSNLSYGERRAKKQEFKLAGLAGTGKTTIIKHVLKELDEGMLKAANASLPNSLDDDRHPKREDDGSRSMGLVVSVCSFTGKAVSVLCRKGLYNAKTLHSLMYNVNIDAKTKEVIFTKKENFGDCGDEGEGTPDLIVFDEASMCSKKLYEDLIGYGIPVLWVGDHGQLEPIGEELNLMSQPDHKLETIHRQAAESPILQLAHSVRTGQPFLNGHFEGKESRLSCTTWVVGEQELGWADIVIVGFNRDRVRLNAQIRKLKNRYGTLVGGDKIIVLKNDRSLKIYNGQIMEVVGIGKVTNSTIYIDAVDEVGDVYKDFPVCKFPLEQGTHWDDKRYPIPKGVAHVDYGYVVTAHKSQGSEWNKVIVFEPNWWGKPGEQFWDPKRWKYTAVTRAAKELIYCRK